MGMWYGAFPYPGIARAIGQAGFGESPGRHKHNESKRTETRGNERLYNPSVSVNGMLTPDQCARLRLYRLGTHAI